jgi:hypothetical protein
MNVQKIIEAIAVTAELTGTSLSGAAMSVMAEDLMAEYDEPAILSALSRCRRELSGRLTLAAIVDRMKSSDSRPGAEEAWSIAVSGFDENATIVTNDEISGAMGVARPIMDAGDEVGARMAFRESYERIVREARERGVTRPTWWPSIGADPARRDVALSQAAERGLLTRSQVAAYLPAPTTERGAAIAGLLTGNVVAMPKDPEFRRHIAELKRVLRNRGLKDEAAA